MATKSFTAKKRAVPRTPVTTPVGEIGKFVQYKDNTKGLFDWDCVCGEAIHIRMTIDSNGDVECRIKHRSAQRSLNIGQWQVDGLFADQLLLKLDQIAKFKNCEKPWRA